MLSSFCPTGPRRRQTCFFCSLETLGVPSRHSPVPRTLSGPPVWGESCVVGCVGLSPYGASPCPRLFPPTPNLDCGSLEGLGERPGSSGSVGRDSSGGARHRRPPETRGRTYKPASRHPPETGGGGVGPGSRDLSGSSSHDVATDPGRLSVQILRLCLPGPVLRPGTGTWDGEPWYTHPRLAPSTHNPPVDLF